MMSISQAQDVENEQSEDYTAMEFFQYNNKKRPSSAQNDKRKSEDLLRQQEKEPLQFSKEQFDEETWQCMSKVVQEANRILWHWKTFPIILPPLIENKIEPAQPGATSSSTRKRTLNIRDLFVTPNFDEAKLIAINGKGRLKRLSKDQLDSIRQTGEFEVDSVEFPGQKHKWILTQLLIKGKTKTYNTLLDNLANCLYLIVGLSRNLSIRIMKSLNGWSIGTMNLMQLIIGAPLVDIVGLDSKLRVERSKFLVADLTEAPCEEGKAQALCNFILEKQSHKSTKARTEEKAPPVPYRFMTPQGLEIDLRLCNQEMLTSAKPHLLHILNMAMQDWIPERRQQLLKHYRTHTNNEEEIAYLLSQDITNEYYDKVCQLIMTDQGISRIHPDMASMLVEQAKTNQIFQQVLAEEEKMQREHKYQIEQELKESNPMLSRVDHWLQRQLREAHEDYVENYRWRPHEEVIKRCKEANLDQSAYFVSKDYVFRKDREALLTQELGPLCKQPSRSFSFVTKIWNPRNWIITEHSPDGKSFVIPTVIQRHSGDDTLNYNTKKPDNDCKWSSFDEENQSSTFSLSKVTVKETNSGTLGWRWINFFHRTNSFFWNCLFFLGIVIPWCSPLSLQALFRSEPFFPNYILDNKSGVLVKDRSSKTNTVMSRLTTLWTHISESRKDFENKPDTGLISKDITRHLHRFVNYVLKGVGGTFITVLCLPLAMLSVSLASIFLALLCPLIVWFGSVIVHLLAALFYDFEGKSWLVAMVWNVLINFIGIGILQPICCAFLAFLLFPVLTLMGCMLALVRKVLRDAWDAITFQLLIKVHGRMPISDGFLAKRIAGPGLAATYYYQIRTEQALAALETTMDLDRVSAYHAEMARQIKQPQEEYKHFVERYFGPFGAVVGLDNQTGPASRLRSESAALLNQLEEKVKKRKDLLANNLPNRLRSLVRLQEEDLKIVLRQGTTMVEKFYLNYVIPSMSQTETSNFWFTKNLKPDDWLGLTTYLLSNFFSPEFMIPLQDVDTTFALKVKHWNLNRYINMALEADWKDDLDVTRVIQTPKMQSFTGQPDIPLESFNPMAHPDPLFTRERKIWLLYKKHKVDTKPKLVSPLPLPHPIEICVIISNRDTLTRSQLQIDHLSFKSMLRLIEESPSSLDLCLSSPISIKLSEDNKVKKDESIIKDEEESHSIMAEMDPAMASLTQSLEELDRDVEDFGVINMSTAANRRPRLSFDQSRSPAIKRTGPGSVPLLASNEDISMVGTIKDVSRSPVIAMKAKVVNPDSYSTIV